MKYSSSGKLKVLTSSIYLKHKFNYKNSSVSKRTFGQKSKRFFKKIFYRKIL